MVKTGSTSSSCEDLLVLSDAGDAALEKEVSTDRDSSDLDNEVTKFVPSQSQASVNKRTKLETEQKPRSTAQHIMQIKSEKDAQHCYKQISGNRQDDVNASRRFNNPYHAKNNSDPCGVPTSSQLPYNHSNDVRIDVCVNGSPVLSFNIVPPGTTDGFKTQWSSAEKTAGPVSSSVNSSLGPREEMRSPLNREQKLPSGVTDLRIRLNALRNQRMISKVNTYGEELVPVEEDAKATGYPVEDSSLGAPLCPSSTITSNIVTHPVSRHVHNEPSMMKESESTSQQPRRKRPFRGPRSRRYKLENEREEQYGKAVHDSRRDSSSSESLSPPKTRLRSTSIESIVEVGTFTKEDKIQLVDIASSDESETDELNV